MKPSVVADYAALAAGRRKSADFTVLRTRSLAGREILAHLVTGGTLDLAGLLTAVHADDPTLLDGWDPYWLGRLGRTLALSRLQDDDLTDAAACFHALLGRFGKGAFGTTTGGLYLDVLYTLGRVDELARLLEVLPTKPDHRDRLWVDLHNPFTVDGGDAYARGRWLTGIARQMGIDTGPIEPISLSDEDAPTPFDRLTSEPLRLVSGPSVSIVVTSYEPGPELLTALRSLAHQTWRDLEILVIDDGSTGDTAAVYEAAEALDRRIRVVRLDENGGTYRARNVGLALAGGDLVTFHDSDDWAHPRRTESQARVFRNDPDTVLCLGRSVRMSPNLELTSLGYPALRQNASSLMFRRAEVLRRVGFMDESRKGADSEYHLRIEAAFGTTARQERKRAFSIVRLNPGSLSRAEFLPGWHHPARRAYRMSYERYHQRLAAGEDPFVPRDAERRFPVPRRFRARHGRARYDVVFIADWRFAGDVQRSALDEIDAARRGGLRVGIAHLETFRQMTEQFHEPLCDPILRRMEDGRVEQVLVDDPAVVGLAIVRDPSVLQFPPAGTADWDVHDLWVVADDPPSAPDGTDARYDPLDCTDHAKHLFGTDPVWVPSGPAVRRALADVDALDLAAGDHPPIVAATGSPPPRRTSGTIRIGRHSDDDPRRFPRDPDELAAAYPIAADISVSFMGGESTVASILGDRALPGTWDLQPSAGTPVGSFLGNLDVFVWFDDPRMPAIPHRPILEAMATGIVVVVPDSYRPLFGDGATYCAAPEVASVVRRLVADDRVRTGQAARAMAHVRDAHDPVSFLERVRPIVGTPAA